VAGRRTEPIKQRPTEIVMVRSTAADYAVWRKALPGAGAGANLLSGNGVAVPEPTGLLIPVLGFALIFLNRPRGFVALKRLRYRA